MGLKFRAKDKVMVEGKEGIGEVSSSIMKEHVDHNGEVVYEEKCYIKFPKEFANWFPVDKLTLAIDNMDYIDPKNEDKINKVIIDAHIDNKNFEAIREINSNGDETE
ncbi:hypothetical protein [Priestia megaterium]|uniref:hypothetical protein n=1 Tax=Priestia megaterium TaxID=1404 RepID=UPI003CC6D5F0